MPHEPQDDMENEFLPVIVEHDVAFEPIDNELSLTPKQERFAVFVVELESASAAYRAAYDASDMSDKTVHEEASRLRKNRKVAARVGELQGGLQHSLGVTRVTILAELEEAKLLARVAGDHRALADLAMKKAKLLGYLSTPPVPKSQRDRDCFPDVFDGA